MRACDIQIGEYYRLKDSPDYGYIKPLRVLAKDDDENPKDYIIVRCEHTVSKNDSFGFNRYFRPRDIIKGVLNE